MPQQFLNGTQVGAVGQQVGGIGMPEAVRVERRSSAPAAWRTASRCPERRGRSGACRAGSGTTARSSRRGPAFCQIAFEGGGRLGAERHLPLFAAFAAHPQPALGEVDVFQVEPDQFADTQPATVEKLENGACRAPDRRSLQLACRDVDPAVVGLLGVMTVGSVLAAFGVRTRRAGLATDALSRTRKWKNDRTAASLRRMVRASDCSGRGPPSHSRIAQASNSPARAGRVRRREVLKELLQVGPVVRHACAARRCSRAQFVEEPLNLAMPSSDAAIRYSSSASAPAGRPRRDGPSCRGAAAAACLRRAAAAGRK